MWKKEDLQNKYVKLSNQVDYETVVKVLHDFGFTLTKNSSYNEKYYEKYPIITISNHSYNTVLDMSFTLIPIQQFYELMPEGFNLNEVKSEEWIPKVGDWVFTDMYNIGGYSKLNCVKVTELDSSSSNQPNFKVKAIDGNEVWCYPKSFTGNNNYFLRKAEPHEIPNQIPKSNSMSKEELLILAKRRYPIGCKIIGLTTDEINMNGSCGKLVVVQEPYVCQDAVQYNRNSHSIYAAPNVYLYNSGKWAEIISLPHITNPCQEVSLPQEEDLFDTKEGQQFLAQGITNKSKIDDNQVNLVIKQNESITLKRIENEINIKVNNLKTIKI
jgi:hypothetical protein